MADGFEVNGQLVYEEGFYSEQDFSELNGGGLSRGVVALLMDSTQGGEPKVAQFCANDAVLRQKLPNPDAEFLSHCLFRPSRDPKVPGGAAGVYLVRVNPAARASITVLDSGDDAATFKYKDWGLKGNDALLKIESGTVSGRKVTATIDGVSEVVDNAGNLDVLRIKYTEPDVPGFTVVSMEATVDPTTGVSVDYAVTHADASTWDFAAASLVVDGSIVISIHEAEATDMAFTVTGRGKSDGIVHVDTVTIVAGQTAAPATREYSSISSIVSPNLIVAGNSNKFTVTASAFALAKAQYPTVQAVAAKVTTASAKGFTAQVRTSPSFLIANADLVEGADITGSSGATFPADLYDFVAKCNAGLTIVTCEALPTGTGLPVNLVETPLAGGGDGSSVLSDWQAALAAIVKKPVNHVVMMVSDPSIRAAALAAGVSHVTYMNGIGRYERDLWVGAPSLTKLDGDGDDNLYAMSLVLNSPYVSFYAQDIALYNDAGTKTRIDPRYTAALACGCEAGRKTRTSLTRKTVDVLDVYDNPDDGTSPWTVEDNAGGIGGMINHGIHLLEKTAKGVIRWKRNVTTWQTDQNPVLCSRYAMQSAMASTRDMREYLDPIIGDGNYQGTGKALKTLADGRYRWQVKTGVIKNYDPKSISFTDMGNGVVLNARVAPVEAMEFGKLVVHFVRMPENA